MGNLLDVVEWSQAMERSNTRRTMRAEAETDVQKLGGWGRVLQGGQAGRMGAVAAPRPRTPSAACGAAGCSRMGGCAARIRG